MHNHVGFLDYQSIHNVHVSIATYESRLKNKKKVSKKETNWSYLYEHEPTVDKNPVLLGKEKIVTNLKNVHNKIIDLLEFHSITLIKNKAY